MIWSLLQQSIFCINISQKGVPPSHKKTNLYINWRQCLHIPRCILKIWMKYTKTFLYCFDIIILYSYEISWIISLECPSFKAEYFFSPLEFASASCSSWILTSLGTFWYMMHGVVRPHWVSQFFGFKSAAVLVFHQWNIIPRYPN